MTRSTILRRLKVATATAALMVLGATGAAAATYQHTGGHGGTHETHESDSGHQDSSTQGQRRGQTRTPGETSERGHRSLEDIFRDIEAAEDEESDRPDWAGGGGGPNDRGGRPSDAGSARGDLYGDMYVILRDANGVPILTPEGFVQPVDASGNPIPLDEEGAPIDPTLAIDVELSRLNVGRSPTQVLDRRAAEVVTLLSSATAIAVDAAGRLVVTSPDGTLKTIDSPLENLALYVALMTTGSIPGVTDLPGTDFDHLVDGQFTTEDLVSAQALLAAAADKYTTLSLDAVAYMNAILGINTETSGSVTYSDMDYTTYSYDRSDTYDDQTITILVRREDGSYVPTEVNVFEAVFQNQDYSEAGTFDAFAQAVDDARAVIAYIHDNEAPEE